MVPMNNDWYQAGFREGFKKGFKEGVAIGEKTSDYKID